MHENKFEKQVQEKMEELQFAPSDAVWGNIDKEINKGKKRRRPVFWLFFLFGFLLLGGGYFFAVNRNSPKVLANVQQQKQIERLQNKQSIANDKKVDDRKKENDDFKKPPVESEGNKIKGSKAQELRPYGNSEQEKKISQYNKNKKIIWNDKKNKTVPAFNPGKEKTEANEKVGLSKERNKLQDQYANEEISDNLVVGDNKENTNKNETAPLRKIIHDSAAVKKNNIPDVTKTAGTDSASGIKSAKHEKKQKTSPPWKIGFSAQAGVSNINQSLFQSTYVTNAYYYTPANSVSSPGTVINNSSKINPGFSFGGGIFVSRSLSKRISFSAGINYHYYSTKIHTGNFVDSARYVYLANASASQANGYYRNGSSNGYTNYYHFIELPLSLDFQLNRNHKMPLIWEAGFSLSYLLNGDALHFDPVTNVYYKNNALFNKTHLNAATAILLGFHIHKTDLQIGPQLQYGLTGLLNKSAGNPEHLFYSGLKISFIPGKK